MIFVGKWFIIMPSKEQRAFSTEKQINDKRRNTDMTPEERYAVKSKRIKDVVALKEPDRVPFAPKVGNYYARGYNISMYDAMKDIRNIAPGVMQFMEDYDPDLAWAPVLYPADPPEILGSTYLKVPGPNSGLALDESFQIGDINFLYDDEYDEFLNDPTHFFLTKVYPRKFKELEPFSKLSFRTPVEFAIFISMTAFADPEVQRAVEFLKRGGEASAKWLGGLGGICAELAQKGYPLGAAGATTCGFDMFSDNIRGLINSVTDIYANPDKLLAAVEYMTDISIADALNTCKTQNLEYFFIPLHAGVDEFMSDENYRKFYWPSLRKLICALIDNGVTPYVFCEGKYNSRLEVIKDVPKGKVIYMFEEVDIVKAKEILGDTACICGNLPTSLLAYGKKERVVEETKRMLDACAPGGGFIMDCSIVLDNAKKENLDAWYETTMEYGKY